MEHLALEIFDLATADNQKPTTSKYAVLDPEQTISITDTSEIFASGDVWSHSFTLNVHANAHIFGTAGDLHGSRLHEQINKRRARLWVEGLPLYLGYLKLDDEAEVDKEGDVDVGFESGQKTFEEMIEGTSAREVSVGDVVIGVALNRKRVSNIDQLRAIFTLSGMEGYEVKYPLLEGISKWTFSYRQQSGKTPYVQRWPKLVKSYGEVLDSNFNVTTQDYTNVQTPYDPGDTPGTAAHPFCNINICYPMKVLDKGEEKNVRGYTLRLAHGKNTTDGDDNQTRYNNAPNFYLLYFIDRLFKDLNIHIAENQALDVEDLRRVFMLNYGCHYEEIEDYDSDSPEWKESHTTPSALLSRYGKYYLKIMNNSKDTDCLVKGWDGAGQYLLGKKGLDYPGKVLLRDIDIYHKITGQSILKIGSLEGTVVEVRKGEQRSKSEEVKTVMTLDRTQEEEDNDAYAAYLAYATGENYPKVEISEIVNAMKSMFGVRLLFDNNFSEVRIVLLRNIFRSTDVQDIACDITDADEKVENSIRGFRMTYGKGTDDTAFFYKGFADLFPRASKTWKDTTDKHDYSQWDLNAKYDEVKQSVSAFNKTCYVTPVNGNAYGVQVDEDQDVLFPSLFDWGGYMDAEDGDCSLADTEPETVEVVQCGATPVLMNEVGNAYASLFTGELKAPAPKIVGDTEEKKDQYWDELSWIGTYGRATKTSYAFDEFYSKHSPDLKVKGDLDVYIAEGFRIRLEDNYAVSNGGTPFDEADPGLCFGIMRSSGEDAYVRAYDDPDDDDNDAWDVVPGSGAVAHPDTCDNYGKQWDYNGSTIVDEGGTAIEQMQRLWPNSNINLVYSSGSTMRNASTYISSAAIQTVEDNTGAKRRLLFATVLGYGAQYVLYTGRLSKYAGKFKGMTTAQMKAFDAGSSGFGILIETDSTDERRRTLLELQERAFYKNDLSEDPMVIDSNGVGAEYGRFSLKLRAEKLNPFFDPKQEETHYDPEHPELNTNPRYLDIIDPQTGKKSEKLSGRGLADQFYKEYSYWVRNARIVKRTVHMELAQLLAIDKTQRVRVGDITGFIRKIQYSVSNKTGLGEVTMEIMYI